MLCIQNLLLPGAARRARGACCTGLAGRARARAPVRSARHSVGVRSGIVGGSLRSGVTVRG
jgi:hypothetical protein